MPAPRPALRALGLTDYESRAYEALVGRGASTAAEIASAGSVPRTRVYVVLASLAEKGWVRVEAGRPKRYAATRPTEAFARERARLDGLVGAALPELEAHYADTSKRFAGALWSVRDGAAVAARTVEMCARARRDILLLAAFPLACDADALPRALRQATRRDVRIRLVVPSPTSATARALGVPGVEARVAPLPPRVLAVDGREAMLAFPTDGEVRAIWHSSPEIMEVMGGILSFLWSSATPAALQARRAARSGTYATRSTR